MEQYDIEEFDKTKTKILKYVLYKKRTEKEIKQKFSSSVDENLLEDVIQDLKENGYIDDINYVERAVREFLAINTLSKKEIQNKLYIKGIASDLIEQYFLEHEDELEEYELKNAIKIALKRKDQTPEEIQNFLYRKGYSKESIKGALEIQKCEE